MSTISRLNSIHNPVSQSRSESRQYVLNWLSLISDNIPFIHTWLTHYIYQHYIGNRIMNAIKPGYSRHKLSRLRREGNTYIFPQ